MFGMLALALTSASVALPPPASRECLASATVAFGESEVALDPADLALVQTHVAAWRAQGGRADMTFRIRGHLEYGATVERAPVRMRAVQAALVRAGVPAAQIVLVPGDLMFLYGQDSHLNARVMIDTCDPAGLTSSGW